MTAEQQPAANIADFGELDGLVNDIFDRMKKDNDSMLPVIVKEFDRAKRRVVVEHLINVVLADDTEVTRGQISDIPVFTMGAGGFVLDFNIPSGSLGWIICSKLDISNFKQSYKQSKPNTLRANQFEDSIFIPHVMTGYTVADEDQQNFVIQSIDGDTKLTFSPDGTITGKGKALKLEFDDIEIKANNDLEIDAGNNIDTTAGGSMTTTATGTNEVTSSGNTFSGANVFNDNSQFNGSITDKNGVNQEDHSHARGTYEDGEGRPVTGDSGTPQN